MDVMWNTLWACYILLHGFIFDSVTFFVIKAAAFNLACMQNDFKSNTWQRDFSMEKMNLTGVVSFSTSASQLQCSILCSRETTCIIFSFNKKTELCSGYSAVDQEEGVNKYDDVIEPEIYSYSQDFDSRLTVYKIKRNFQDAATTCATACGQLLVLDTLAKMDYILRRKDLLSTYWIGLSDQKTEGEWLWANENPFISHHSLLKTGFNNFDGNQVGEKRTNADCAVLRLTNLIMYDVHCSKYYNFICEAY